MKYIVYDHYGEEKMVIWAGTTQDPSHEDIAEALGVKDKLISAGFFYDAGKRKKFIGESMSLNIGSREEVDLQLYQKQAMK